MITEDDEKFLQSFEECSLGAKCWTHAAHIRMAWLVLEQSATLQHALDRIRSGIMRFNSSKNSIGYHETITVVFAQLIDARRQPGDNWSAFTERNPDLFDKNILDQFYSRELLFSDRARQTFVEPDLNELPFAVMVENC